MAQDSDKLVITPHADGVARLAFSPDGRYVAFPLATEKSRTRADPPSTGTFDSYLYTSGYEGLMRIFDARPDAQTGEEPAIIDYHQEAVTSIAASVRSPCAATPFRYP